MMEAVADNVGGTWMEVQLSKKYIDNNSKGFSLLNHIHTFFTSTSLLIDIVKNFALYIFRNQEKVAHVNGSCGRFICGSTFSSTSNS